MLGPHHGSLKFCTLLMFVFFHLHGTRAKLRGIPLSTHAESFDASIHVARLHEDLQILRLRIASEIEPISALSIAFLGKLHELNATTLPFI